MFDNLPISFRAAKSWDVQQDKRRTAWLEGNNSLRKYLKKRRNNYKNVYYLLNITVK